MRLPLVLERPFRHERGHCWRVQLPEETIVAADTEGRPTACPLGVMEDGVPIGPGHRAHADIADRGAGQFSLWQDGWLYFSASDNSDPNANGRNYMLDLREAGHVVDDPNRQASPAAASAVGPAQALPTILTPRQAFAEMRRGLDALYPRQILDFNLEKLESALSDLQLVTERYDSYRSEMSGADVAFLSINCAGRTWIRFFLHAYIERATGIELSLRPQSIPRTALSPSVFFTHDFVGLFETIPAEPWIVFEAAMRERPLIVLTRDPRDLAVSRFLYLRGSEPEVFRRLVPSGQLSEFVDSPLVGMERFSAFEEQEMIFLDRHPGPKIHFSYERLHATPRIEFERLLNFLSKAPIRTDAFEQALQKSTFSEMQALEIQISRAGKAKDFMRLGVDNWSGDVNDLKVRAGKVGRFREFLPDLDDPEKLATRYPITSRILSAANSVSRS